MNFPQRKPIRLRSYDYSQNGYYFVTICVEDRKSLLWSDSGATIGRLPLNDIGTLAETALKNIESLYPCVSIDEYVIMPNHLHFILVIQNDTRSGRSMIAPTISRIVQQFKGYVTKKFRQSGFGWQKSFYEKIIRTESDLQKMREYIWNNPANWWEDAYYPQ